MEEQLKVELERIKLTNYILQKENEILLGTIGIVTREKQDLLNEIAAINNSRTYKLAKKLKRLVRRH